MRFRYLYAGVGIVCKNTANKYIICMYLICIYDSLLKLHKVLYAVTFLAS